MGNFFLLQAFTVVFALSIATTIFNKRILGFPQAIGVLLSQQFLSLFYMGCQSTKW
jgi:CPA1 family monovalent cation:H+ antiporter